MRQLILWCLLVLGCGGCYSTEVGRTSYVAGQTRLVEIGSSARQWTGLAIAQDGTMFANFPRWSDDVPVSVGRLASDRQIVPVPDLDWNSWTPDSDPKTHWICVQSVVIDDLNRLWVLDPASPFISGVVPGGAKLLCLEPSTGATLFRYYFAEDIALPGSYLNDVRVDTQRQTAYISDSGEGAIIVLDLVTGVARRVLSADASTNSQGTPIVINGRQWSRDGKTPEVHCDGIALSRDGGWLYYHALTGKTLYRIQTRYLRDKYLDDAQLARHVEKVGEDTPCDGMEIDDEGAVYLTDLDNSAIVKATPPAGGRVKYERVVTNRRLEWPDSFAWGPDGALYVTTSRIHLQFEPGMHRIFRLERAK